MNEWNSIKAVVQSCATAAAASTIEGQFARSNKFNKLSISQAALHPSIDLLDLGRTWEASSLAAKFFFLWIARFI